MPEDIDPIPATYESVSAHPPRPYPEPKQRELTDDERYQLRARIEQGDADIYALAREFGCSSSQVAGIKAAMNR
jgi:transposase-like protein